MRSACSFVVACSVVLAALALPQVASAQSDRARARTAYARGQQFFDAGRYAEAEAAFQEAYRIIPNPVVLLGIAETHSQRGDRRGAIEYLQRYLQASPSASDRREIEDRIRELGGGVGGGGPGTIVVRSVPDGASVAINGRSMGTTPYIAELPAGRYQVQIYRSGYETITQTVDVRGGEREDVEVELEGEGGQPVYDPETGQYVDTGGRNNAPNAVVWAMAGVTGAALVTGTVMGFLALSEQGDFDDAPTTGSADRGERFALIADISFGLAAAAAATGIILYFTGVGQQDGRAQGDGLRPAVAVSPLMSPEGGGVSAIVEF